MKRLTVIVALTVLAMAAQAQAGLGHFVLGRASKHCQKCEPCVCKCDCDNLAVPVPAAPPKPILAPASEEDRERVGAVCALSGGVYLPDDPLYEVGECGVATTHGWRCCWPNGKPETWNRAGIL